MAFKAGILVGPKQTTFIPAFEFSGIKNEHQEVTAIQSDKLTAPLFSMQTVKDVEKKIITVCWLARKGQPIRIRWFKNEHYEVADKKSDRLTASPTRSESLHDP
jgi:hypothetical protein